MQLRAVIILPSNFMLLWNLIALYADSASFIRQNSIHNYKRSSSSFELLMIQRATKGSKRGTPGFGSNEKSKRQFRVGQVVRAELASIIRSGHEVKYADKELDGGLRNRISVVNADVSPDLRQARVTISIMSQPAAGFEDEPGPATMIADTIVEKRLAYSWLVKNTKQIRHALAQRLKHMKSVPSLTFAQADVGAAVDVMQKIDNIFDGRDIRSDYGGMSSPEALFSNMNEEDLWDDDEWDDEEDEDFEFLDDDDDEDEL